VNRTVASLSAARGIALAVALLASLACGPQDPTPEVGVAPQAISMSSVTVRWEELVEAVFGTGTIVADKTTNVGPRVDGIIEEIYVEVGDRVEEGQALFRTRQVDYEIRAQEAEYAYRMARAELEKLERDLARIRGLHERQVASDEQLDAARTAAKIATARRGGSETAYARARQNLADTLVTAPYAGVITSRRVDEGTMMRTMMSSGTPVVQIMKIDTVIAIVQLPEVDLPRVSVGASARLKIAGTGKEYESSVYILNDSVDPVSRAFEIRLRIPNSDMEIKPGLFVQADILPESRETLVIERRAVLGTATTGRFVYMSADGKAARRAVRVRELDTARIEVLEGRAGGDRVLAGPNLPRIEDGTPVRIEIERAHR